jgi:tetratricopeptide (TPR) repeat protein
MHHNGDQIKTIQEAYDNGYFAHAAELARRYVAGHPTDPEGLWLRGAALYELSRYAEARLALEDSLAHLSQAFRGPVCAKLAECWWEAGRLAEAEDYLEKAIEADPGEAEFYVSLSDMLIAAGKSADAERWLQTGLNAGAAPSSSLHFALGKLYRSTGDIAKAAGSFGEVLRQSDHEDANTAIADVQELAKLTGQSVPVLQPADDLGDATAEPGNLTANIHREFFVEIAAGRKKIEYREFSNYWFKRISNAGAPPFHLRLINGMQKNAPELSVVVDRVLLDFGEQQYELHLGEVLEVKNWDPRNERLAADGDNR